MTRQNEAARFRVWRWGEVRQDRWTGCAEQVRGMTSISPVLLSEEWAP